MGPATCRGTQTKGNRVTRTDKLFTKRLNIQRSSLPQLLTPPEERNDGSMPEASGPETLRRLTCSDRGVPPLRYRCG